jgi:hypothetical protein
MDAAAQHRDVIVKLRSGERARDFRTFLSAIDGERFATTPNQLIFLHSLLPHKPWEYLASGAPFAIDRSIPVGIDNRELWDDESFIAAQAFQRYLLQVEYLDSLIGQLIHRLEELGLYEKALIVVTADHGVAFRPGLPRRVAVPENEIDVVAVPMLIKAPGQKAGVRVRQPVSVLDILPTVAGIVGLDVDWPTRGRMLMQRTSDGVALLSPSTPADLDSDLEASADFFFRNRGPLPVGRAFHQRKTTPWRPSDVGPDPRRPQALPQLLGTRAPEQRRGQTPVRLVRGNEYERFDEQSEELRYVVGEIEVPPDHRPVTTRADDTTGPEIPSDRLGIAISIDGVVAATTWAFPPIAGRGSFLGETSTNHYRFAALLGEGVLQPGFNDLTIQYIREGASGETNLVPTSFATPGGRLATSDPRHGAGHSHDSLVTDEGPVPLLQAGKTSGITGFLQETRDLSQAPGQAPDASSPSSRYGFSATGWAIDKTAQKPVERIFFFYRDELVTTVVPTTPQRWVVENHGLEAYLDSGFEALISPRRVPQLRRFGLEVIASSAGRAAILDPLYPRLASEGSLPTIHVGDGRRLELEPATPTLKATIDRVRQRDGRLVVVGWAGDLETPAVAEAVVLFRSGEYQTHLRPNLDRSDLTANGSLPPELERSGFRLRLPLSDAAALLEGTLTLVAVSEPGEVGSRAVRVTLAEEAKAALEELRP